MANNNNPNPNRIKISPWLVYGAAILLFLFISYITGGSSFEEPLKTSSSKFNSYLEKSQVEKVIIYNKTEAEVYLTKEALKDKIHEIHNYLRNNGAGYGMNALKVFNILYGLKKLEEKKKAVVEKKGCGKTAAIFLFITIGTAAAILF